MKRRKKKGIGEMSLKQRIVASVLFVASLGIVAYAEKDLQGRPDVEVRGTKLLWRLLSLNSLGALAYLGWGRRPSD